MTPRNPKKIRVLILGGVVLAAILIRLGVDWYTTKPVKIDFSDEMIRQREGAPEKIVESKRSGPVRLAIGPLGLAETMDESGVADLLVAELSRDPKFLLLERREFRKILQEIQLGEAGAIKAEDAIRIGRLLGADWFLFGTPYRSGTNLSSVIRIVSADRGIIRDLLVLPAANQSISATLSELKQFLQRNESGSATGGQLPVFLAVGGFADQSIRPRHPGLEAEVRSFLATSLADQKMVMLERELTRLLLDEIRLQQNNPLAASQTMPRMQSTFWLVDGFWQSFDGVGDEIDMTVRVSRIGGAVSRKSLRALRGSPLNTELKRAVLTLIQTAPLPERAPTRLGEIRTQLNRGIERAGFGPDHTESLSVLHLTFNQRNQSLEAIERKRENLAAAIQSFEAALLLDPNHAEARLLLARCYMDPAMGRQEEARNIYRELLDHRSGIVSSDAKAALGLSYRMEGDHERAVEWFEGLIKESSDNELNKQRWRSLLFLTQSRRQETYDPVKVVEKIITAVIHCLVEARSGREIPHSWEIRNLIHYHPLGMEGGHAELARIFPQIAAAAEELEPVVLSRAVDDLKTNDHPLINRLDALVSNATTNPAKIFRAEVFFNELPVVWALEQKLNPLAGRLAGAVVAARKAGVPVRSSEWRSFELGMAFGRAQRYREALEQMNSITNGVLYPAVEGPWGHHPAYIVPMNYMKTYYRELGEPMPDNPARFLPEEVRGMEAWSVFLLDGERLWIATSAMVIEHPLSGGTPQTNRYHMEDVPPPRAIAQTKEALWIGTADQGLVRFDKSSRKFKRYTTKDGLLFDDVCALDLVDNRLYLGYGFYWSDRWYRARESGGLSVLDISQDRIQHFTPLLLGDKSGGKVNDSNGPPRRAVGAITHTSPDEIWFTVSYQGIQRYHRKSDTWDTLPVPALENAFALCTSEAYVAVGDRPHHKETSDNIVLTVFRRGSSKPEMQFGRKNGLPLAAVTCLALDGDWLWVGGPAYLVLIDLKTRKVARECLMNNTSVHNLIVSGDHVWVMLNSYIYKVPRTLGKNSASIKK